jgi:hypothetical protein
MYKSGSVEGGRDICGNCVYRQEFFQGFHPFVSFQIVQNVRLLVNKK